MVTGYYKPNLGHDMTAWNAKSAMQGTRLQMSFEPHFMSSDRMCFEYDMGIPWSSPSTPAAPSRLEEMPAPPAAAEAQRIAITGAHAYKPHQVLREQPPAETSEATASFAAALEHPPTSAPPMKKKKVSIAPT